MDGKNAGALPGGTASVGHVVEKAEATASFRVPLGIDDRSDELSLIANLGPCGVPQSCRVMWLYKWVSTTQPVVAATAQARPGP